MTLTLRFHKYLFIILFILFSPKLSFAEEFEILSVKGVVELSTDQKIWQKASPPQKINSGTWIRTGPYASAALVLPNKTQTRIAKNSELLLKSKEKKSEVKLKHFITPSNNSTCRIENQCAQCSRFYKRDRVGCRS